MSPALDNVEIEILAGRHRLPGQLVTTIDGAVDAGLARIARRDGTEQEVAGAAPTDDDAKNAH